MTDDELYAQLGHLLALLDGLPTTPHLCGTCRSPFQLSVSHALQDAMQVIARELHRRGAKLPPAVLSRWQLLELS